MNAKLSNQMNTKLNIKITANITKQAFNLVFELPKQNSNNILFKQSSSGIPASH